MFVVSNCGCRSVGFDCSLIVILLIRFDGCLREWLLDCCVLLNSVGMIGFVGCLLVVVICFGLIGLYLVFVVCACFI